MSKPPQPSSEDGNKKDKNEVPKKEKKEKDKAPQKPGETKEELTEASKASSLKAGKADKKDPKNETEEKEGKMETTKDKDKEKDKEREKTEDKKDKKTGDSRTESTASTEGAAKSTERKASASMMTMLKKDFYTADQKEKFNLKEFVKWHFVEGSKKMEYELHTLHILLDLAKTEMEKSETLIEVQAPVNICGDIHGQYGDLMRIFNACGPPFKSRYLFLGDYVDRGRHSLEVIVLLLSCRVLFPTKVFLLRGNHELANINKAYGFHGELRSRYRTLPESKPLYDHFNDVFALMPLAAIVSGRILCMHGGLSPALNSLDDIRKIQRPLRIVRGLAQDLLWADPEAGLKGFQPNKIRAVSYLFGEDAVHAKCKQLDIDLVIRAHQVVEFGYAFFAQRSLITVFSASRYHEELLNYAAVVQANAALEISFVQLKPSEFDRVRKENVQKREQTADGKEDEE